jgi:hypothetical protein
MAPTFARGFCFLNSTSRVAKRRSQTGLSALGKSATQRLPGCEKRADVIKWDERAGLRRDAVRSQVIDTLEAQEIKETDNEEG